MTIYKRENSKTRQNFDVKEMTAQMDNDVTGVNIFHNERAEILWKKELSWPV